jgi:hypothetical protein
MKIEKALKDNQLTGSLDLSTQTVTTDRPEEAAAAMKKVGYDSKTI